MQKSLRQTKIAQRISKASFIHKSAISSSQQYEAIICELNLVLIAKTSESTDLNKYILLSRLL